MRPGFSVYMENGRIAGVTTQEMPANRVIDARGCFLTPGFIELHVHGGGGFDFADGTVGDILAAARAHARHGTTALCPTAPSLTRENTRRFLIKVKEAMGQNGPGRPYLIGSHLEGPHFADGQKGAQDPRVIRSPDPAEAAEWLALAEGTLTRVSFAPELPGTMEFLDTLNAHGVLTAYAHTEAVYEELLPFIRKGSHRTKRIFCRRRTPG